MRKTIKIKFVGFWKGFNPSDFFFFYVLNKYFNVVVEDNKPDYIICSLFDGYIYLNYDQPRIMFSGENYIPDLNIIDYCISPYPLQLFDRSFRSPSSFSRMDVFNQRHLLMQKKSYNSSFFGTKCFFANFISSHESEHGFRGEFYNLLSKYKRIESCGTYLNNMNDGYIVHRKDKLDFQRKCKFTLCFESTSHNGFITEKILDAYLSNTIPVYYGSDDVEDIFNSNSFINVRKYPSFDDAIEFIKYLDNNDEAYIKMINEPVFNSKFDIQQFYCDYEKFIINIFKQNQFEAYRRAKIYFPQYYESCLRRLNKQEDKTTFIIKVKKYFKRIIRRLKKHEKNN